LLLNGKSLKVYGVCNHHDLGFLGAAVNKRAIERQVQILKGMGINGIRTSHNPPAPELLEVCDHEGVLVMDEAFDMWRKAKTKYDYHFDFDQWHQRDLTDQVKRDRNHASVFLWSIGNEIPEQWDGSVESKKLAKELGDTIRNLDKTRPVTAGSNNVNKNAPFFLSGALDVLGFNYKLDEVQKFKTNFPGKKMIISESTSAFQTRGYYQMPSSQIWKGKANDQNMCSSYDHMYAGSSYEELWKVAKNNEYVSGFFMWTGFDYLGEPTPYGWPSRSSFFWIVD
jgi:beta-galactosidase